MSDASGPRTLGVVGTLVWDTIVPHGWNSSGSDSGAEEPIEEWGGIAYSLAALSAAVGGDWAVLPIVKVGQDLRDDADRFMRTLPAVDTTALTTVPEPNNRVELRYRDPHERTELLSGGVPGWTFAELRAAIDRCDALYLNFISGFEMSLDTATELRRGFSGPIYADLHSLLLGVAPTGERVPRALRDADRWFGLFDAVQMNRSEAALVTAGGADLTVPGPAAAIVTGGPAGVQYDVAPELLRSPPMWPAATRPSERPKAGRVEADPRVAVLDPTGCGDVWGAVCFASLLNGSGFQLAAERASRLAEVAATVRGASTLRDRLATGRPAL